MFLFSLLSESYTTEPFPVLQTDPLICVAQIPPGVSERPGPQFFTLARIKDRKEVDEEKRLKTLLHFVSLTMAAFQHFPCPLPTRGAGCKRELMSLGSLCVSGGAGQLCKATSLP